MCLTKVYYNTYSDGAQDITEKSHPCRDGRGCSHPDVRKYDRKFPFTKLGDAQPESHRSLSERQPTPYFLGDTPRGSKSPSPSRRRDSGVYMSGANPSKHYDYSNPYASYDAYGYPIASRHDPRDRYDRGREPRLKRSSTAPQIVYADRDGKSSSRSRSNSNSRDYSHDIPLGLVPLADEYGRRHRRHSSSSRSHSRDEPSTSRDSSDNNYYHRHRRTDDPTGYTTINDQDERRRHRREQQPRRLSTSGYPDPSTTNTATAGPDPARYLPRRAATVIHHGDAGAGSSGRKQLRWEDQVRAKRDRQNAEIASRQPGSWSSSSTMTPAGEVKGILKHHHYSQSGKGKGKGREEEIADLRRAVERMEIPRGRDREPTGRDEWGRRWDEETLGGGRGKRSKVWGDDSRYRY